MFNPTVKYTFMFNPTVEYLYIFNLVNSRSLGCFYSVLKRTRFNTSFPRETLSFAYLTDTLNVSVSHQATLLNMCLP